SDPEPAAFVEGRAIDEGGDADGDAHGGDHFAVAGAPKIAGIDLEDEVAAEIGYPEVPGGVEREIRRGERREPVEVHDGEHEVGGLAVGGAQPIRVVTRDGGTGDDPEVSVRVEGEIAVFRHVPEEDHRRNVAVSGEIGGRQADDLIATGAHPEVAGAVERDRADRGQAGDIGDG